MLLVKEGIGDCLLLDVAKGLAKGKALDLQDFASLCKQDCLIEGSDDFSLLKNSDIVVITAGLARKPGMTRDDLLKINSGIIRDVSLKIKEFTNNPIVITITNPVDLMVSLVYKFTGFDKKRVFGMGVSLDAGRFANLIHQALNASVKNIEPVVVASHGQAMLPLGRLTKVSGKSLDALVSPLDAARLKQETVDRGASIVAALGSGSAYFAPAMATVEIISAIAKDEKRVIGVCAYLDGEYGVQGLYLGVPACIGKSGVEKIIELELNAQEKEAFAQSAETIRAQLKVLS